MKEHAEFIFYQGKVFRVFATAYPSQDLLDDIISEARTREAIQAHFYDDALPQDMNRIERVRQRSERSQIQEEISKHFKPEAWYQSRYSDGSFGVLYTAETQKTALTESLYHKRNFYLEEIQQKPVQIDLRMVSLKLKTERAIDLLKSKKLQIQKLVSQDDSGYPYCQKIAQLYYKKGAELLRTPSARDHDGFCVPIFRARAVQKDDGHLKYFKCVLSQEKTEIFKS